jgi:hypothetical protein
MVLSHTEIYYLQIGPEAHNRTSESKQTSNPQKPFKSQEGTLHVEDNYGSFNNEKLIFMNDLINATIKLQFQESKTLNLLFAIITTRMRNVSRGHHITHS